MYTMQDRTATRISRTVVIALLEQRHARRGAAASTEAAVGIVTMNQARLEVLRRERQLIARRRALAARPRTASVRQAYSAVALAA